MILTTFFHSPVLLPEVIEALNVSKGKRYIDATIGGGGYSFEILKQGGIILGIDTDKDAINYLYEALNRFNKSQRLNIELNKELFIVHGNFGDLRKIASRYLFLNVSGIIFDLGLSTYQLELSGRGFTYQKDEPLDMRMDKGIKITAADLINRLSKEELYEIFTSYAEELNSGAIAQAIIRARSLTGKILTTKKLVDIINEACKAKINKKIPKQNKEMQRIHARIFQALRITVNYELDNLKRALWQAIDLLNVKGRIVVLSYHSLEDRIVKRTFFEAEEKGLIRIITSQPIRADKEEINNNPKSKAAKMRVVEKK